MGRGKKRAVTKLQFKIAGLLVRLRNVQIHTHSHVHNPTSAHTCNSNHMVSVHAECICLPFHSVASQTRQ